MAILQHLYSIRQRYPNNASQWEFEGGATALKIFLSQLRCERGALATQLREKVVFLEGRDPPNLPPA